MNQTPQNRQDIPKLPQDLPHNPQDLPDSSGKIVLDQVIETLRENDEAKKELYSLVRSNLKDLGLNINPEPFFEKFLGEMKDKRVALEEHELSLRELAENVILFTEDGYSQGQIARELGIYPNLVKTILRERKKWEKEIRKSASNKLPWYLRILARLNLLKL